MRTYILGQFKDDGDGDGKGNTNDDDLQPFPLILVLAKRNGTDRHCGLQRCEDASINYNKMCRVRHVIKTG